MAFASTQSSQVFVGAYDLTSYIKSVEPSAEVELGDSTVLGDAGRKHLPLLVSGGIQLEGLYDQTTNSAYDVLKTAFNAGSPELTVTVFPEGATVSYPAILCSAIEQRLATPIAVGSLIPFTAYLMSEQDGVDMRGVSLHPKTAETATGNGTTVDSGASSANGGVGVLHVTAQSGTSTPTLTAKIQHSTDGSTWADLVTFLGVNAGPQAQRIEVAAGTTVNRYLRVVFTISGTNPSFTFVSAFARR